VGGYAVSTARYLVGDVRERLAGLPDGSVDLLLTSPPFLALRSYLPPGHPDKANEMGSEPTPGEFIDGLLDVVEIARGKLAPHGSIAIELGDTYAGSGGAGGDYGEGGMRDGQNAFDGSKARTRKPKSMSAVATAEAPPPKLRTRRTLPGWPVEKSLCLVPELFRVSLVYGFNPLTGRETPRWRARNVVRWERPNPPVGDLGDKFRPATSDMVVACVGRRRYFDLDAVRTPHKSDPAAFSGNGYTKGSPQGVPGNESMPGNPAGAPPLDWWEPTDEEQEVWDAWADQGWVIPTKGYSGSHYAVWPPMLCVRPIKAMCPERVCLECGRPSERLTGEPTYVRTDSKRVPPKLMKLDEANRVAPGVNQHVGLEGANSSVVRSAETLGWSCCGCGKGCRASAVDKRSVVDVGDCKGGHWRRGVVLDPFAGSGTTLMVATGLGRDAIGIDLDERNLDLARERVGMFLEAV
jgi:site-specific DNA-methyltransferase (cytosine-N4-specific)